MNPTQFRRFTILRKLPAGGMGRVYEASDPKLGRRVALKLIDRGTDSDSRQIVAAERLGAELQRRLCALDPRITSVLEFGEDAEYFYIVMEYVDGQDLSELNGRERLGHPFAARIAQDVLEVLHHTHNFRTSIEGREVQGIVHGDIKPRNIRLTTVGQVKVLDFGIAKALSMTRSFTQNVFGSVQYSSPERLNSGEVTVSSDLWSVGMVLFELIARRPYFECDNGTRLEHIIRGYRELKPFPEECPEALRAILARALAPDAPDRYSSAAEFAADLHAYRGGALPGPAFDAEATRRVVLNTGGAEETRQTVATEEHPTERTGREETTGDMEATRRTGRGTPQTVPMPPKAAVKAGEPAHRSGVRWGRVSMLVLLAVLGGFSYVLFHEFTVWREARRLAHDLETEKLERLDVAWQKYQDIAARSAFGFPLWGAQDALRNRLLADADRVIDEYRTSDAPSVSENEWVRARTDAARALELMPRDKEVRGHLRLADGHLGRIRGTTRRDARLLESARDNFSQAAELMPKSPDPWLGLSRLYVYSLHDVDRGEAALREAERRKHEIGKRETAQLADGYRDRAERSLREAGRAASRQEADRYLELARKDYDQARELYESITPWGDSAANLRRTYDGLTRVEQKREE